VLSDALALFPGGICCFRRKGYKIILLRLLNPLILDVDSPLIPAPVTTPRTIPPPAGIPRTPETPIGISNTPGSVVLTLRTRESGTTPPQMFSFVVNITLTPGGTRSSRILEANEYMDNEQREFTIDGLMAGGTYLFSAQAQNEFGSSGFVNSQPIGGRFQCVGVCGCVGVVSVGVCVCVCVWVWMWYEYFNNPLLFLPSVAGTAAPPTTVPPPQRQQGMCWLLIQYVATF